MAQNLQKYHVPISAKKKGFSIFTTKKLYRKTKIMTIFGTFFFNSLLSNSVRSTVVYF